MNSIFSLLLLIFLLGCQASGGSGSGLVSQHVPKGPVFTVTTTLNKTYVSGENIEINLTFPATVTVTGIPSLTVTVGASSKSATYISGSGSETLVFRYTVTAGDSDSDGISIGTTVSLNAGTLTYTKSDGTVSSCSTTISTPATTSVKVDTTVPTITGFTPPTNTTYYFGMPLLFTVAFSESVTVTGIPRIAIDIGGTTKYASFVSGSGTASLLFQYSVTSADSDSNGIALTSPLDLNGGTIRDAVHDATLTYVVPNTPGVIVAGQNPLVTFITTPSNATYVPAQNLDFTLAFSKSVVVSGSPRLLVTIGASTKYATYLSGSGTSNIKFRYTVLSGDKDTDGIALSSAIDMNGGSIVDSFANSAIPFITFTLPTLTNVLVDGIDLSVSSVTPPADGTYKINDNLDFTVTYNYPATVTGTPRLTLTVGSSTAYATYLSGSGTINHIYRLTVSSGQLDSDGIALGSNIDLNGGTIRDDFGDNAILTFSGSTYANKKVDGIRPTFSNPTASTNKTYVATEQIDFTFAFSEAVVVSGTPRLVLSIGGTTRYATYQSGSGTTTVVFQYTVQTGDLDADGIGVSNSNTFDLNTGTLTDLAGNSPATFAFTPPPLTGVTVDAVSPTITSISGPGAATYNSGSSLSFTINFSETVTVTGSPTLSLIIGATSRTATYVSGSGSTSLIFTHTVAANDSDSDGVSTSSPVVLSGGTIKDAATNNAALSFSGTTYATVLVDAVIPTVQSLSATNGTYKPGANLDITLTFNKAVNVTTTGGTPSIQLTIGSLTQTATYLSGSGTANLVFRYQIATNDDDYNGLNYNATLSLNGGTIRDNVNNSASTTMPVSSTYLSKVFTVPASLSYWYDLSDSTTYGSSGTTLTQFVSKLGSYSGTITGSPLFGLLDFNTRSGGATLSSSDYVTFPTTVIMKYVVIVFKTPSAAGHRVLNDTVGSNAFNRAQVQFQASGANGLNLGGNCATSCKRYSGSSTWTATNSGQLDYTWSSGQYRVLILDFMSANNISFQIGQNGFDGQIAELMFFTGSTTISDNAVFDRIYSYLNSKHGAVY